MPTMRYQYVVPGVSPVSAALTATGPLPVTVAGEPVAVSTPVVSVGSVLYWNDVARVMVVDLGSSVPLIVADVWATFVAAVVVAAGVAPASCCWTCSGVSPPRVAEKVPPRSCSVASSSVAPCSSSSASTFAIDSPAATSLAMYCAAVMPLQAAPFVACVVPL